MSQDNCKYSDLSLDHKLAVRESCRLQCSKIHGSNPPEEWVNLTFPLSAEELDEVSPKKTIKAIKNIGWIKWIRSKL